MAGDKDQRTEKPTARRKKEARKEGQLARSPELVTWVALLVATLLVQTTVRNGSHLLRGLMGRMGATIAAPTTSAALGLLGSGLSGTVGVLLPLLVVLPLLGIIGNVAQIGFAVSLAKLRPKWDHLDPRKGLRRLLSPQLGWEATKQLLKVGLLGLVAWRTISGVVPVLTGQGPLDVMTVASATAGRALGAVRTVAAAGLAIAAVDYGIARRRITRALRMTKQELKEENKSSDGNPFIKGAIRRRQRQMSRMRMIAAIASADAVVVNPTHVAVALRYEPGSGAPRVVAKGIDSLALRIKAEARAQRVPMVEDRGLARALHAACPLDSEIPAELYEAVARLLSFVYALQRSGRGVRLDGDAHVPPRPLLTGAA